MALTGDFASLASRQPHVIGHHQARIMMVASANRRRVLARRHIYLCRARCSPRGAVTNLVPDVGHQSWTARAMKPVASCSFDRGFVNDIVTANMTSLTDAVYIEAS